jgi:hypothetical protein
MVYVVEFYDVVEFDYVDVHYFYLNLMNDDCVLNYILKENECDNLQITDDLLPSSTSSDALC